MSWKIRWREVSVSQRERLRRQIPSGRAAEGRFPCDLVTRILRGQINTALLSRLSRPYFSVHVLYASWALSRQ